MSPAVLLMLSLAAAPTTGLVIAKRNGVSRPVAQTRAEAVREALGESFAAAPIEDVTSCNGKRPCLVKEARQRGWAVLLVIETATVLDDALVNVVLLSVDDDGREVERVALQATQAELATKLLPATEKLRAELTKLLTLPSSAQVQPPRPVETRPMEPVAPPLVVREGPPPGRPAARWIPAATGVVALGVGVGFAVASKSLATRLGNELFLNGDVPRTLAAQGQTFQSLGTALIIGGSTAALAGLALALLWPENNLAPVAIVSARGGLFGVAGTWP